MSAEMLDPSEWGEAGTNGKLIADAEAEGHMVSIGSDGQRWLVNWAEDPDRAATT